MNSPEAPVRASLKRSVSPRVNTETTRIAATWLPLVGVVTTAFGAVFLNSRRLLRPTRIFETFRDLV